MRKIVRIADKVKMAYLRAIYFIKIRYANVMIMISSEYRARKCLEDIANSRKNKECVQWSYGSNDYSCITDNITWAEWIEGQGRDMHGKCGLIFTVNKPFFDQHLNCENFGEKFYFADLLSGKEIEIPTGSPALEKMVKDSFCNGMVVRLMPSTVKNQMAASSMNIINANAVHINAPPNNKTQK